MNPPPDNEPEIEEFLATSANDGERLDRAAAAHLPERSRSRLQSEIKAGNAEVNGVRVRKPRHPLTVGDRVRIRFPVPKAVELTGEEIPLAVLFEDDQVIIVDKPSGLVVHPGAGNPDGTLVNALLHHCDGQLSRAGDVDRPGIVHRIDKETSGCLVAAKTDEAYRELVRQFAEREVEKTYLCVVQGIPDPPSGRIENRIGRHPVSRQRMAVVEEPSGKVAITDYEVIGAAPDGGWSAVRCHIHTGRTHQIRVHMKESLRCPILGDEIYAQVTRQPVKSGRLLLHAWSLGFRHPATGERLRFRSPLPEEFAPFSDDPGR